MSKLATCVGFLGAPGVWGEKSCVADVTSLGHTGFVVWVFERLVGHLIARPGQRFKAISVPDGSGAG